MPPAVNIALIGDHDPAVTAHRAIPEALRLVCAQLGLDGRWDWIHTASVQPDPAAQLAPYTGLWCVPASPYASTAGALAAIRWAREQRRPFLGTCGGFQHALMEYATAVWRLPRAAHAELEPQAPDPLFVATLFQPERAALAGHPPPLVRAFVQAAAA